MVDPVGTCEKELQRGCLVARELPLSWLA
jgi:hypothetical protein